MVEISPSDIEQWADKPTSPALFPELIRRLVHCTVPADQMSEASFPSNIFASGWDGKLICDRQNAWVPKGISCWEFSTKQKIEKKFHEDYEKRSSDDTIDTFIFATPRQMPNKEENKCSNSPRHKIRIYDSADLAEWLKSPNALAANMWFAEQIGRSAGGLISVDRAWDRWAKISEPAISEKLILADRDSQVEKLKKFLNAPPNGVWEICADSREESVAFICAAVLSKKEHRLADKITVVDSNPEHIEQWTAHAGAFPLIFLLVNENMVEKVGYLSEKAHILVAMPKNRKTQNSHSSRRISLRRISESKFKEGLASMRVPASKQQLAANHSSRSVTVFRRRHATSSTIKNPSWAQNENIGVMVAAALTGRWDSKNDEDRNFVSSLSGCKNYENFEDKIAQICSMGTGDVPLEKWGSIWEIRSQVDALTCVLQERNISSQKLDLFLQQVKIIFTPTKRKVSGSLSDNVVDTLAILSNYSHLIDVDDSSAKIDKCVKHLLLKDFTLYLTPLAEASPDVFLEVLDSKIKLGEPVSQNSILGALATLAWDGIYFSRIVNVVTKIIKAEEKGLELLSSFFLPWYPHCGASDAARKDEIESMKNHSPNIAFALCLEMLTREVGNPLLFPVWREVPESSANLEITHDKMLDMRHYAFSTAIDLHCNKVENIEKLIKAIPRLAKKEIMQLIKVVRTWHAIPAQSEDVALVREEVGHLTYWFGLQTEHERGSEKYKETARSIQEELQQLYDSIIPQDIVQEHLWLFSSDYPELPDGSTMSYNERQSALKERRSLAMTQIIDKVGDDGIWKICSLINNLYYAGESLPSKWGNKERLEYMHGFISQFPDFVSQIQFTAGILFHNSTTSTLAIDVLKNSQHENWEQNTKLVFLLAAHPTKNLWDAMEAYAPDIIDGYWKNINPYRMRDLDNLEFLTENLLKQKRPWEALDRVSLDDFSGMTGSLIARALKSALEQRTSPHEHQVDVRKVISFLQKSKDVDASQIRDLEISNYSLSRDAPLKQTFGDMAKNPDNFIQILKNSCDESLPDETRKKLYFILRRWNIPPGMSKDKIFSDACFEQWKNEVLKQAKIISLLSDAYECIGAVLIHLPHGEDSMPMHDCSAARKFLNGDDAAEARESYEMAIYNSRGVVWRGEGGGQERKLAQKYRKISNKIDGEGYSRISAIYRNLAKDYERQAAQEDKRGRVYRDE